MPRRNFSTLNRIVVVAHLQCRIAALQILLDIDAIESKIAVLVLVKNFLIETPSGVADFKSRGGRCQDVGRMTVGKYTGRQSDVVLAARVRHLRQQPNAKAHWTLS